MESLTGREEHPAIVAAKKELLGTSWDTTIQQDLQQLFDKIDMDCSGRLELREVVVFFKAVTDDISKENIERIFNKLDLDISKSLDFDEFQVRNSLSDFQQVLLFIQRLFHHIAVAGWKKMFKLEELEPSEEEMEFCFDLIDSDHDGLISLQEGLKSARLIKDRFGIEEVRISLSNFRADLLCARWCRG